jgi:hypothetical protein
VAYDVANSKIGFAPGGCQWSHWSNQFQFIKLWQFIKYYVVWKFLCYNKYVCDVF